MKAGSCIRILHVIPAVAPRYGGPSTALWPLVAALRNQADITVEIATTDADGPGGRITAADLPPDAGTVHLFRRTWGETYKYSPDLGRWISSHIRDYDLIQTHGQWNYPTTTAARVAGKENVPCVLRPCGMFSPYSWQKSAWKKRAYWWLLERRNFRQAAGFHVTSREEQQEVLRLGTSAPVETIPLGLANDAGETPVAAGWLREQFPEAGNRPIVLFLSRLHPKKGITDFLLPAFARLRTEAFLVIGGGEDSQAPGYLTQIQQEIDSLGLRHRIGLLGTVSAALRWWAFDGASAFVLPSHSENFGQVVAEAMARGVPVIITTGVQLAEHVTASKGGIVVPPDVEALALALDKLLYDVAARQQIGRRGQDYARAVFSWNRAGERLAALYKRVISQIR